MAHIRPGCWLGRQYPSLHWQVEFLMPGPRSRYRCVPAGHGSHSLCPASSWKKFPLTSQDVQSLEPSGANIPGPHALHSIPSSDEYPGWHCLQPGRLPTSEMLGATYCWPTLHRADGAGLRPLIQYMLSSLTVSVSLAAFQTATFCHMGPYPEGKNRHVKNMHDWTAASTVQPSKG